MSNSCFHEKPYDAGTLTKLKIFELYVQAWIPVFVSQPDPPFSELHIFDLFSGPGTDSAGTPGSPLRILSQLRSYQAANMAGWSKVKIKVHFSDANEGKIGELRKLLNKPEWTIPGVHVECDAITFEAALEKHEAILRNKRAAKLLIIDQFGVDAVSRPEGTIDDPKLRALVHRIRQVFSEHGLEPAHLARFLAARNAPFTIGFGDIKTDATLLNWLTEPRIDWIAKTFLIRREWIDGEDDDIHERFYFDRQPQRFFSVVSQHVDALVYDEVHDDAVAYFLRWGVAKDWLRRGEGRVFVVVAVPIARLSNERTIYKYISDFEPYPWTNHVRTNIQLRAWARLLFHNKAVPCFGHEITYEVGQKLWSNSVFLRDVLEEHLERTRDDWHPEDHALYKEESIVAKDTDTLPRVIEYLRINNLPWENSEDANRSVNTRPRVTKPKK